MTTPIQEIISVSLLEPAPTADADNPNAVLLVTDEQGGVISSANRYKEYSRISDVVSDFGSLSKTSAHARSILSQSPNPIDAEGSLIVGFWRGADEDVPATAGVLEGATINESMVIDVIREVSDGSFSIDIDGETQEATGLDFTGITSLSDVASIIEAAIPVGAAVNDATVEALKASFKITSATTGATSTLSFMTAAASGTFIGELLGLTDEAGATTTDGADATTLTAETKVEALDELKADVGFRGAFIVPQTADNEVADLAAWAQANTVLLYDVFTGSGYFDLDTDTNPVWAATQAGQTNYRMLYRKDGNRRFGSAYMGRAHTVNFNADNSALTMHLKTLSGVTPEVFTQGELNDAETVGLDLYVSTKNRPWVRTSGANDFVDNRYNLIAFVDAVETDLFNFLGSAGTKVAQTLQGVQSILDQAERTTRRFVRANVFAPGEWLRPDTFGDRETFLRSIRDFGYFWMAGDLADQSQADRENRLSPPLQAAVKNAGAIHSADVIIQFDI